MAIKGFKEVVDNKGYRIDSKDREIFERELKESLFGTSATNWDVFGNTDMIEFVLYDTNDNQLPQGEEGKMVRYISMDDPNIQKYFVISEDIEDIKLNGAKEFLVDTEVLIKEAGYSNGIFKTQITLVNRRAGSEVVEFDKMWIHEISPSRTEIRILPVNGNDDKVLPDLQERYDVYINDGEFRDDTISFVQQYVEEIDLNKVFQQMLRIKGKTSEGQGYIDLIKKEFKIEDFGRFLLDVKTKFVKSMQYWVENRNSNPNSLEYGKIIPVKPPVQLSVKEIKDKSIYSITETIDYFLNKRDILEKSTLSQEEQITFDEIQQILNTTTVDSDYDTTLPESIEAEVRGCTDPNAMNFNPDATMNDGSCIYQPVEPDVDIVVPPITADTVIRTKTYYIWSEVGSIIYKDIEGKLQNITGRRYEFFEVSFQGVPNFKGDVRTYPEPRGISEDEVRCNDVRAMNYGQIGACVFNTVPVYENPHAEEDRDLITYPDIRTRTLTIDDYYNRTGDYSQSISIAPGASIITMDYNTLIRLGRTTE